jgi:hypothetical protein
VGFRIAVVDLSPLCGFAQSAVPGAKKSLQADDDFDDL